MTFSEISYKKFKKIERLIKIEIMIYKKTFHFISQFSVVFELYNAFLILSIKLTLSKYIYIKQYLEKCKKIDEKSYES